MHAATAIPGAQGHLGSSGIGCSCGSQYSSLAFWKIQLFVLFYFDSMSAKNPFDTSALYEQLLTSTLSPRPRGRREWSQFLSWMQAESLPLSCSVTKSTSQRKADLLVLWTVSKFFPVLFYFKEQNLIINRKLVHLNPGPVASYLTSANCITFLFRGSSFLA